MAGPKTPEIPKAPEQPSIPESNIGPGIPEKQKEKPTKVEKKVGEEEALQAAKSATSDQSPATAQSAIPKSETLRQIENILQEDLRETYQEMPPDIQKQFKEKGEETAKEIESMMTKVKVNTKKIFKLIFVWLKIIPGVNKYFLQQEAKLKADKIIHVKEELDKSRSYQ